MSEETTDPRLELATLVEALRAHAEWQITLGAKGLPAASAELSRERGAEAETGEPLAAPNAKAPPTEAARPLNLPAAPREDVPLDEKKRRLAAIASEVAACTTCRLHATRTQTVFARGDGSSRLCFVGEGPGADEDAQGYPFVGKAGQLLDRMIAAMGFSRDEVYVANIVKCRPPDNRKPEPDEMAACVGFLERQLEILEPEVIVALGATALQGLFGTSEGITRVRGKWRLYKGRIAVMPTFHPAYLLRNPAAKRDVWNDLQAVLRQMGRPIPPPKKS